MCVDVVKVVGVVSDEFADLFDGACVVEFLKRAKNVYPELKGKMYEVLLYCVCLCVVCNVGYKCDGLLVYCLCACGCDGDGGGVWCGLL